MDTVTKGPDAGPPRAVRGLRQSEKMEPPASPAMERERFLERERLLKAQQRSQQGGTYGSGGRSGNPNRIAPSLKLEEERHVREVEGKDSSTLVIAFMTMILVGTGNRVFMKLQTYPMYNYPFFLSMLTTFIYIPACFLYIVPMMIFGSAITAEQRAIPKHKFMVMGLLDSVAGIMGVFAVNYIANASMIVLLQQAAIPISMAISKLFLKARYSLSQYMGATVVVAGIIFTMIPTFVGGPAPPAGPGAAGLDQTTQIVWSVVQVLSCIPMCLSSVYKEQALGELDIDVIYLNGWVAVYQFSASVLFAVPSAIAMGLPVRDLPDNIVDGMRCFLGTNSVTATMVATTGPMDFAAVGGGNGPATVVDHCELAPLFVSLYMAFNIVYNVVLIVILKHGSANVLWLASTIMVPIGNVTFSLKFVPGHQDLRPTDIGGLVFILAGLVLYRFSAPAIAWIKKQQKKPTLEEEEAGRKVRLVERGVTKQSAIYVGLNQAEFLEPIINTRVWRAQRARLARSPEQIRGSFLLRLGIPPSPHVSLESARRSGPGRSWLGRGGGGRPSPQQQGQPLQQGQSSRPSPVLTVNPKRGYIKLSSHGAVAATALARPYPGVASAEGSPAAARSVMGGVSATSAGGSPAAYRTPVTGAVSAGGSPAAAARVRAAADYGSGSDGSDGGGATVAPPAVGGPRSSPLVPRTSPTRSFHEV